MHNATPCMPRTLGYKNAHKSSLWGLEHIRSSMSTVHSIPPYHHSKWHQVAELVDVKILAFELQERYADLLALKRDMKRYTKSHSTIDRGNFLRYLTAASELVVGKGNFLGKQISPDFLPFAYLVNNEDNEVL